MNNYREKINENNAELRECIDIAENLPDAPELVNGYDIATMQKFVDAKTTLRYLYYNEASVTDEDITWLSKVDTSHITQADTMLRGCAKLTAIPLFDTSNIESFYYAFGDMANLTTVPLFNTSSATTMNSMLIDCPKLQSVPLFNTSNVTNFNSMFMRCKALTTVPLIDTSKATDMSSMFSNCSSLTVVPALDYSNATTLRSIFSMCGKITGDISMAIDNTTTIESLFAVNQGMSTVPMTITLLNTEKVTRINMAFNCLEGLTSVCMDLRSCTSTSSAFYYCKSLTNLTLKNIKTALQVGSGDGTSTSHYGHLLTIGSLIGLCYECRDTGSSKTLTVGSANLTKLENVYVKTIDVTDEMTAVDDLVSEKLPFEAYVVDPDNTADITSHVTTTKVSSVDELPEGAVLMSDYVVLKNWKLA